MISKPLIQFIRSLENKKIRDESRCFIVEGEKLVREALDLPKDHHCKVLTICGLDNWLDANVPSGQSRQSGQIPNPEIISVSNTELERISIQKTPNQALAVIFRKEGHLPEFNYSTDLLIGLDHVQDPGNVGTLVRLADWFGLGGVIASPDSADFYSPKVVQSSMGSIFRVKLMTSDLLDFVASLPHSFPVYGTRLDGQDLYKAQITANGLILLGNESRGLSSELSSLTSNNLYIPDFSSGNIKPESLNVSIAAAIVCSEFRRRGND